MRPPSPPQELLFDLRPEGAEIPIAERVITPGCLLPVPENQVVDLARAGRILGLSDTHVRRLRELGLISGYQLAGTMRWMIVYESIVAFCDTLRIEYDIRDRRPKLALGRRWRDEDILPFPLADTVAVDDVMRGLGILRAQAIKLLDEGKFEAYRFYTYSLWRISKTSLFDYHRSLKAQVSYKPTTAMPNRQQPRDSKPVAPSSDGR